MKNNHLTQIYMCTYNRVAENVQWKIINLVYFPRESCKNYKTFHSLRIYFLRSKVTEDKNPPTLREKLR